MTSTRSSATLYLLLTSIAVGAPDKASLEKISPEEAGWSESELDTAAKLAGAINYTAMTILHDGKEVFSWGEVKKQYKCHSIREWFLSALYGIYVDNGTIDLDLTVGELGIDDIRPSLSEVEKTATLRQLLKARSGVYHPAAGENAMMKEERPERHSHAPGTFHYYNNWDFNVLGVVFEQLTGKRIFDAFKEHIADPIGMQDFDPEKCYYYSERKCSRHPVYAFRMTARDMARFGLLYQNNGAWEGEQIIPKKWMKESTTPYSQHKGAAFGYMIGILLPDTPLAELFGGTGYFFSGAGVHTLLTVLESKYVLVLRTDSDGDFGYPDRARNKEMYETIIGARVKKGQ